MDTRKAAIAELRDAERCLADYFKRTGLRKAAARHRRRELAYARAARAV